MSGVALRAEGLCKRFGDAEVLRDVTFEVRSREVVGLVGENGAGKSTLLKLLAGIAMPDAGRIVVRGAPARWRRARDAAGAGVGLMLQEPSLVPGISVAENILLGHEGGGMRLGVVRWHELNHLAEAALHEVDPTIAPAAATLSLAPAQRQLVAFARALAVAASADQEPILLLDEPTCALDAGGIAALLGAIERLRARASIVFVSHRLGEVMRVCDRIVVLRKGRCVAERRADATSAEELHRLVAGRPAGADPPPDRPQVAGPIWLEARQLSRSGSYADVNLALRGGEVTGLTGAAGSGCHELGRTLFGIDSPQSGSISIDGRTVALRDPADAMAQGIAYVPADRACEGVIGALSVAENIALADRTGWRIDHRREHAVAARWIERLRITTPSPRQRVSRLSGGNQQKVALAKWLAAGRPRVLILDDPLRALDVLARRDVVDAIREVARGGTAVLVVADSLDELLAVCDSVAEMRDGRICERRSLSGGRPASQSLLEA